MNSFDNLSQLVKRLQDLGATQILAKPLSENDNSKQQIYLGGSFEALAFLPHGEMVAERTTKDETLKAPVSFFWVTTDTIEQAPGTQIILYPKYPEVRLSGFIRGCGIAPGKLLQPTPKHSRKGSDGRVLFFGITPDRMVLASLAPSESPLAEEVLAGWVPNNRSSLFIEIPLDLRRDSRSALLEALCEIHLRGCIPSSKLNARGELMHYAARNGAGYTLEAMLGIRPNGDAQPDYLGWEIKASSRDRITLMTPEPRGGLYGEKGTEAFVRKYGYLDPIKNRFYFTGIHAMDRRAARTGLTLKLDGFDPLTGRITDAEGSIALVEDSDVVAASWSFATLLTHWNRKHASAAYVKYEKCDDPLQYRFLSPVYLAENTDFEMFLRAVSAGYVFLDPGSKVENANGRSVTKARNQFRVTFRNLGGLYRSFKAVALTP